MKPSKTRRSDREIDKSKTPNALTVKTIEDAHNGVGLSKPIKNLKDFVKSI